MSFEFDEELVSKLDHLCENMICAFQDQDIESAKNHLFKIMEIIKGDLNEFKDGELDNEIRDMLYNIMGAADARVNKDFESTFNYLYAVKLGIEKIFPKVEDV